MKKNINKLVGSIFVLALLLTSCNDDDSFTYELPEQASVTQVTLSVAQSASSQCTADLTVGATDVATVYYLILPSAVEAPNSEDVFDDGAAVSFDEAGSATVTSTILTSGVNYTVYAVSVNKDGLRSEQVFTTGYAQPQFGVIVDTTYTSSITALGATRPSHTATLTPISGNSYAIDSAWGPNFVAALTGNPAYQGQFLYAGTLTINSDFTVTIVASPTSPWATGGTGTYNPCTNVISYTLTQALFTNPFTASVVLTPNNL